MGAVQGAGGYGAARGARASGGCVFAISCGEGSKVTCPTCGGCGRLELVDGRRGGGVVCWHCDGAGEVREFDLLGVVIGALICLSSTAVVMALLWVFLVPVVAQR